MATNRTDVDPIAELRDALLSAHRACQGSRADWDAYQQRLAYRNGLADAWAAVTGEDPAVTHEWCESVMQDEHDRMIDSMYEGG